MKNKPFIFFTVLITAIFCITGAVQASCIDQNFAQKTTTEKIQCLNALIAEYTQQINIMRSAQSSASDWCHTFSKNLGYVNSGDAEVGYLHTALDKEGISYAPDSENVYGSATAEAVLNYQKKFRIFPTGYAGDSTRAQLNADYGCKSACVPNWQCGDWGTCLSGQQSRTCTDSNVCGNTAGQPSLVQNCTTTVSDTTQLGFGIPGAGWLPISGDWDGDGKVTVGAYDSKTSTFYLRNSNTTGVAGSQFGYGQAGWKPVTGDWDGDGITTVGVYDPAKSIFHLTNKNAAGYAEIQFGFGTAGAGLTPISGDWDGDGKTTVGLYDSKTATYYLTNSNTTGVAGSQFGYGTPGWLPISGDWDGDGVTTIGSYNASTGTFYVKNKNDTGYADATFTYKSGMLPIAGDWDGDGKDTVGVYEQSTANFYLKNSNTTSITAYTCTDSDGGIDYNVKGLLNTNYPSWLPNSPDKCGVLVGPGNYEDRNTCSGSNCYIIELYCDDNHSPQRSIIACSNGCSDGACSQSAQPTITVTSPSTGTYSVGANISISWNSTGLPANALVSIGLNGVTSTITGAQIATNVLASSGNYSWTVPSFLGENLAGKTYNAYVTCINCSTPVGGVGSAFTIAAASTTPSITVTSPNGGESFTAGTNQTFKFSSANIPAGTRWDADLVGTNNFEWIAGAGVIASSSVNNQQSIGVLIPQISSGFPAGNYKLRVSSIINGAIVQDLSDNYFAISASQSQCGKDSDCPTLRCFAAPCPVNKCVYGQCIPTSVQPDISVIYPNGGEALERGRPYNITWTATGADRVNIELLDTLTNRSTIIASNVVASTGSYGWVPTATGTYKITVSVNFTSNTGKSDSSDSAFTVSAPVGTCSDSDNGKDYFTKGNTTSCIGSGCSPAEDSCTNSTTLKEVYCDGTQSSSETYTCPNGCESGACKKSATMADTINSIAAINAAIQDILQQLRNFVR